MTHINQQTNTTRIIVNTMVRQFVEPVSACFRFPPHLPQHLHRPKQQQHISIPMDNSPPNIVRAIIPAHHRASYKRNNNIKSHDNHVIA